jgi:hypothetical protein
MYLIRLFWLRGAGTAKRAMIGEIDAGIITVERDCANLCGFTC